MQVAQTAGVPPKNGRISLPINGCTRKSSVALANSVRLKSSSAGVKARRDGGAGGSVWGVDVMLMSRPVSRW